MEPRILRYPGLTFCARFRDQSQLTPARLSAFPIPPAPILKKRGGISAAPILFAANSVRGQRHGDSHVRPGSFPGHAHLGANNRRPDLILRAADRERIALARAIDAIQFVTQAIGGLADPPAKGFLVL